MIQHYYNTICEDLRKMENLKNYELLQYVGCQKFVHRYTDESDRRKVYLKLTQEAQRVLKIHDQFHNEMIERVFAELEIDKDEVLMKSLENISKFFRERY